MIPGFLLNSSVTIEEYQGNSAYGPVYSEPYTARCRIEPYQRLATDKNGNEVVSNARVFLPADVEPPPESKVTHGSRTYIVIESKPVYGLSKVSHVECILR